MRNLEKMLQDESAARAALQGQVDALQRKNVMLEDTVEAIDSKIKSEKLRDKTRGSVRNFLK